MKAETSTVGQLRRRGMSRLIIGALKMAYVCRGCGTSVSYPGTFPKCPVCGIKWG